MSSSYLILGHGLPAPLCARHRPLWVELALLEVPGHEVELDDGLAAEALVLAADVEPGEHVAEDPRHRLQLLPVGDRQAVDGTRRLAGDPLADAAQAERVLALGRLKRHQHHIYYLIIN